MKEELAETFRWLGGHPAKPPIATLPCFGPAASQSEKLGTGN